MHPIYGGRKTNKHCAFRDSSFAFAFVCNQFSLNVRHASQTYLWNIKYNHPFHLSAWSVFAGRNVRLDICRFTLQCGLEKYKEIGWLGRSDTFDSCNETIIVRVLFCLMEIVGVIRYSPQEMSNFDKKFHEINEMATIPAVVCLRMTTHLSSNE